MKTGENMNSKMKTILFFDDWLLQNHRGLLRKWFTAEPWPGYEPQRDPNLIYSFIGQCVYRDRGNGKWMMLSSGFKDSFEDENNALFIYDSDDGIYWRPHITDPEKLSGIMKAEAYQTDLSYPGCGLVCFDENEKNLEWRFKNMVTDLKFTSASTGKSMFAFSADGVHWKVDKDSTFRDSVCDGGGRVLFNPYTQKHQFTQRPCWLDRRIFLYQTKDFRSYEGPMLVIHPDAQDGLLDFYSMQHYFYEGCFVGFIFKQHADYTEAKNPARANGRVDCEFLYSINGIQWNRPNRDSVLPEWDGGLVYRGDYYTDMILDDEGWIRLYTSSHVGEHGDFLDINNNNYLTISRLRRDGFCAYETDSTIGEMTLRPLIAEGGEILLNAKIAHYGSIRAELRMVPDNLPIPGYELENSIPVTGDGHFLKLRWKNMENVDGITGKAFRLYLEMKQARIYAIRVNACYMFGWHPQPDLTGNFYPNILLENKPWNDRKPIILSDK
jgi:hypothetical protein